MKRHGRQVNVKSASALIRYLYEIGLAILIFSQYGGDGRVHIAKIIIEGLARVGVSVFFP